jgi:hypothetical protein
MCGDSLWKKCENFTQVSLIVSEIKDLKCDIGVADSSEMYVIFQSGLYEH